MKCEDFRHNVEHEDAKEATTAMLAAVWRHGTDCEACRNWYDAMMMDRCRGNRELFDEVEKSVIPDRIELLQKILNDPETREELGNDIIVDSKGILLQPRGK